MLQGKLQEPIDTEKLRLAQADPAFQKSIAEYIDNPVKDISLTTDERSELDIPMYSLSEVFPDFKKIFKPIKTLIQEINLNSICGTVEHKELEYKYGFLAVNPNDPVILSLVEKIKNEQYNSNENPIRVHAIPFNEKFEGFVANGAEIVAAHKLAGRDKIWAEVTFYKEVKKRKNKRI